jgi:hypothetical protein
LVRTVVVCAPKIFSVIPEPKAAPNPSLRGRCIRITKVSSTQTITRMVSKIGIKIDSHIRAGNMGCSGGVVKGQVWERRNGEWAMGRTGDRAGKREALNREAATQDKPRAKLKARKKCRKCRLVASLLTFH